MEKFFNKLGRDIYESWRKENFSLEVFPGIAQGALDAEPPASHVDLDELLHDFLLSDEQPYQSASGFGQPELIVFDSPKFYIQILFWLDGTTDIHQHEFSGAFHVMHGSSIHSEFSFENAESVTAHFRVGNLRLKQTHLLETGSTVPIVSGRAGIHALFHLETPSVTVVVRTHSDPGTGPQFTYLPPHLAVDPVQSDTLTARRKQLLDMLERTGDERYPDLVAEMIGTLDFERGFFILQNCMAHLREIGAWDDLWELFEQKHGQLASFVLPTIGEILRRDTIAAMRGEIEDVEHRFFLALLLNLESRDDLLKMVGQKMEGDPLLAILRWAEELMQMTESGLWILDARFPEELDRLCPDAEGQAGLYLMALAHFLNGGKLPKELKSLSKPDIALVKESFLNSSWRVLIQP
jgi:hypothetical protein